MPRAGQTLRRLLTAVPPAERLARRLLIVRRQITNVRRYQAIRRTPAVAIRHVLANRELANFTYEISNISELTSFLASALDRPHDAIASLITELETDTALEQALRDKLKDRADRNNAAPYGRRIGWYVAVRLRQPTLAVETGTHDGLGSAVILRALQRNASEGAAGRLLSIDLDPTAGWLVPDWLRGNYEQRFQDSNAALGSLEQTIDLAVLDSAHIYDYERAELNLVAARAHQGTVVISDDPGSRAFADFCTEHELRYFEFREKPIRHIHNGAGLGLAQLK
jgi:predicted O-methyltransferase YrrM